MARHNELGKEGESLAIAYLKKEDYNIIEINWRKHKFEIDIIARHQKEIVFVEVKTRSTSIFGSPEESVSFAKQKHLIDGANLYLEENEIDLECRFDIIAIVCFEKRSNIKHIKNAFYPQAS